LGQDFVQRLGQIQRFAEVQEWPQRHWLAGDELLLQLRRPSGDLLRLDLFAWQRDGHRADGQIQRLLRSPEVQQPVTARQLNRPRWATNARKSDGCAKSNPQARLGRISPRL